MRPLILLLFAFSCFGQTDPWVALHFLEGTWEAKTQGTPEVAASGVYTFQLELNGHVMARHSSSDPGCKGPAEFNCAHGDLLYAYEEPGQGLKAIYFDNEGHTIHYSVSGPAAGMAVFISDAGAPGPQFRLVYELKGAVMAGKFQMRMPGGSEWKSYLEWVGEKRVGEKRVDGKSIGGKR